MTQALNANTKSARIREYVVVPEQLTKENQKVAPTNNPSTNLLI